MSEIEMELLERYLAHVHARELSTGQKGRLLGNLRTFLGDVRIHDWAPGLPANATYFDGEVPRRSTRRLPRFIDEFVMGQIESDENLARLPDLTTRTAIVILIETGLRSVDALRLPFDPDHRRRRGRSVSRLHQPQARPRGDHPGQPAAGRADPPPAGRRRQPVRARAAALPAAAPAR